MKQYIRNSTVEQVDDRVDVQQDDNTTVSTIDYTSGDYMYRAVFVNNGTDGITITKYHEDDKPIDAQVVEMPSSFPSVNKMVRAKNKTAVVFQHNSRLVSLPGTVPRTE